MAVQINKQVMTSFVTFINSPSESLAKELITPDAVFHVPGKSKPLTGPEGYLDIIGMMRTGFPDIQWTLDEMVAENDRVAARFTMRGTHQGPFWGVPATGKTITVSAVNFYRFSEGKIIEERGQPDLFLLLQQIGSIPA
ncbi:ester cyclase [Rahnella sp. FC061912-K]|uniref:ester cyclase n=1 Tax=Rahnella rivi TaxID=2816249 RepID=UPI001C256793|nr:ester cyclase [Rahnella rivi]MBU9828436.1 ester cyclase [Rahnella rivi]